MSCCENPKVINGKCVMCGAYVGTPDPLKEKKQNAQLELFDMGVD